jgi:phage terminase small subunit
MKLIDFAEGKKPISRAPKAPKHLSLGARRLWAELCSEWRFNASELSVLSVGLEAWDRLQEARKQVDREGLTVVNPETGCCARIRRSRLRRLPGAGFCRP